MTVTLEDLNARLKRQDTSLRNIHKLLIEQRNDALVRDEALNSALKVLGEQLQRFDKFERNQCETIGGLKNLEETVKVILYLLNKREAVRTNLGAGY